MNVTSRIGAKHIAAIVIIAAVVCAAVCIAYIALIIIPAEAAVNSPSVKLSTACIDFEGGTLQPDALKGIKPLETLKMALNEKSADETQQKVEEIPAAPAPTYAPDLGGDRFSAEINPYTGYYRFLTRAELYEKLRRYDWDADLMFHIITEHESRSIDTMAANGVYQGICQIWNNNNEYTPDQVYNPDWNISAAYEMYLADGRSYGRWAH